MERQIYEKIFNFLLTGGDRELRQMLKETKLNVLNVEVQVKRVLYNSISKSYNLTYLKELLKEKNLYTGMHKQSKSYLESLYNDSNAYFQLNAEKTEKIIESAISVTETKNNIVQRIKDEYISSNRKQYELYDFTYSYNIRRDYLRKYCQNKKARIVKKKPKKTVEPKQVVFEKKETKICLTSKKIVDDFERTYFKGRIATNEVIHAYNVLNKELPK